MIANKTWPNVVLKLFASLREVFDNHKIDQTQISPFDVSLPQMAFDFLHAEK